MIKQMVNSSYRLILNTEVDVSAAAARSILVVKPDNSTLIWPAVLLSAREIYYDVSWFVNDMAGRWLFTSSCLIGVDVYIGETKHLQVSPAWAPFEDEV
jgi:hypothetical protein